MNISIKRVYDAPSKEDGVRLFVDRLWPRGIKKENLRMDSWVKEIAPSPELRRWFGHDPSRFKEFEKKYVQELNESKHIWKPLMDEYVDKKITLLYAAKDPQVNHAQCLKSYLQRFYS
jgi:uncharacterized protein YeaO (DUF488 family)